MLKVLDCCKKINYFSRNVSIVRALQNEEGAKHKRKVKETVELVTLVDQNDKILGLKPKEESVKLARKLNLSLERVHDTKYGKQYPAYKMFSTADVLKEEKKTSDAKVLKKLPLNSRITEHDLSIKIQIIRKWLSKNCEVHVAIMSNNESESLMKTIFFKIQEHLKDDCRILDVRHKPEAVKFILMPPKQTSKKEATNNTAQKKDSTEVS